MSKAAAQLAPFDQVIHLVCDGPSPTINPHPNPNPNPSSKSSSSPSSSPSSSSSNAPSSSPREPGSERDRIVRVHYSRLWIHGGPLELVTRHTYPAPIPPIPLPKAPVTAVQLSITILYAGAVDLSNLSLRQATHVVTTARRLGIPVLCDAILLLFANQCGEVKDNSTRIEDNIDMLADDDDGNELIHGQLIVALVSQRSQFALRFALRFFATSRRRMHSLSVNQAVVVAYAVAAAPAAAATIVSDVVLALRARLHQERDALCSVDDLRAILPLLRYVPGVISEAFKTRLVDRVVTLFVDLCKAFEKASEEERIPPIDIDALQNDVASRARQLCPPPQHPIRQLASVKELWQTLACAQLAETVLTRVVDATTEVQEQQDRMREREREQEQGPETEQQERQEAQWRDLLTAVLQYAEPYTPDDEAVSRMVACVARDMPTAKRQALLHDASLYASWSSRAARLGAFVLLSDIPNAAGVMDDSFDDDDTVHICFVVTVVRWVPPFPSCPRFQVRPVEAVIHGMRVRVAYRDVHVLQRKDRSDEDAHALCLHWSVADHPPPTRVDFTCRQLRWNCACPRAKATRDVQISSFSVGCRDMPDGPPFDGKHVLLTQSQINARLGEHMDTCALRLQVQLQITPENDTNVPGREFIRQTNE